MGSIFGGGKAAPPPPPPPVMVVVPQADPDELERQRKRELRKKAGARQATTGMSDYDDETLG